MKFGAPKASSVARSQRAVLNPKQEESSPLGNLAGALKPPSFSFTCDMPPTANHMHTVARGRKIKSNGYRSWIKAAGWQVAAAFHEWPTYDRPVSVILNLPKLHPLADLDNRIKPLLDLCQSIHLIKNDNLVHEIKASWRRHSYIDQTLAWVTVSEIVE